MKQCIPALFQMIVGSLIITTVCTATSFTLLKWWKELKKFHCFSCIDLSSWFVIPILIIDKA